MTHLKVVPVGDFICDKTRLLFCYQNNAAPLSYIPQSIDVVPVKTTVDGQEAMLTLWDTAHQEDYPKLRPMVYQQTDVFFVLFSLVSPESAENLVNLWVPEITEHCPEAARILVGVHLEEREELSQNPREGKEAIPMSKGEELKAAIGAQAYVECSMSDIASINKVFEAAARAGLRLSR